MNRHRLSLYFLVSVVFFAMLSVACSPSRPSGVLSEGDMEDVLYDMHVAQAMGDGHNTDADLLSIRASVLRKYDITQAEWDSSFNYYCRNADVLHNIYVRLNERIQSNVIALGGKVDGVQGEDADTANVWNTESSFVLMQQAPYNSLSFVIEPDSTFEDGDRIALQFDAQFIFQDGFRDLTAYLVVVYEGDSVATNTTHVSSDGHGIVTISDEMSRRHVKLIKGYFMLCRSLGSDSSNNSMMQHLRLAAVRNVKLLHTHTEPPVKPKEMMPADSLRKDSLRVDSMRTKSGMTGNSQPLVR